MAGITRKDIAQMNTQEVEITKSRRGWSVHTTQHWEGWPNPAITHSGVSSLAWAIYTAADWASENNTKITVLTVKGKAYPKAKAIAAIEESTNDILAYTRRDAINALDLDY